MFLGLHYSREKDDVVIEKDYLVVYGKIVLEFNNNDFIEETFMVVICFGFGWSGFDYVSKLLLNVWKYVKQKISLMLGYLITTKKWL